MTAATDRWPLVYLFELVGVLFHRSFASSVVNSALAYNEFLVPFVKRKWSQVASMSSILGNKWKFALLTPNSSIS